MHESPVTDQYKLLIDHLPFGIFFVNTAGFISEYNTTALRLFGLAAKEILHTPITELIPLKGALADMGPGKLLEEEIILADAAYLFTARHVPQLTTICTLTPSQPGVVNLPIEHILNSSEDEVFITDADGKTQFINSAGISLYGIHPQEMVGRDVSKLVEGGFFSPSLFPIVKQRKEKVSMIQRTKTGKITHVIASPVLNPKGEMTNIIFNGRDITEIKHLREKIERNEMLLQTYKSELEELQNFHQQQTDILAFSPNMRKIYKMVNKIARVDTTILITGESGVGKGVIAKFIHDNSPRKGNPMVHINCGAIPDALIESELFGYRSGAFTGASKGGRKGLIEQANGGTLFLDEIGEMPVHSQVKLLKVLQERKIHPIGGSSVVNVDIRIIAATNQNLKELVESGEFREDLYYRLNVVPLHIPPLKERPEDVSHMIDYFLKKMNDKYGLSAFLSLEVENTLIHYDWPGNVRELENLIERLVVTADSNEITVDDLPVNIHFKEQLSYFVTVNDICSLKQAQDEMEEQLIRKAYSIHTSSYKIADLLGINQSTAIRKINKYIKKN